MKLTTEIKDILKRFDNGGNYIIFYDGKAIHTRLDEGITISVHDDFDGNDFYKTVLSDKELEIDNHIFFSSIITISKDAELLIIHLGEEEKYLSYSLIVNEKVKAKVENVYDELATEINAKLNILCEDNSELHLQNYTNFLNDASTFVNAYCLREAYIRIDDLALNNKKAHHFTKVYLTEEEGQADLLNVVVNSSGIEQDYKYNIIHGNANTTSTIMNYGIAKNNSYLSFDNLGHIVKGAKKASMSQKTKGIILDMYSGIGANPILEIDENDVIANHGASIGAIDEEQLFYLMSRGITFEESEKLIVNAFIAPYLQQIKNEKLKGYIEQKTKKYL